MPHFYVPPENFNDGRFTIPPEEARHLSAVLRKKPGDEIQIFDGENRSFRAVVEKLTAEGGTGRVVETLAPAVASYALRLFQGFPKGDKFEWILEKAAELGVTEIIPFTSSRSVGKVPAERAAAKMDRWEKILLAASKQCGRSEVPALSPPMSYKEALISAKGRGISLLPWEGESARTLKSVLEPLRASPTGRIINVIIGPEGGFSPQEVEEAKAAGVLPVTLGPLILRTETAGLFVASVLQYEFGKTR